MTKNKSLEIKGAFENKHDPIARDLRTPKYRKRIEETKVSKENHRRGIKDYELE